MLTNPQAGAGPSLSGLSPKNDKPPHDPVAESQSDSQGAFAAILAEDGSEPADGKRPDPTPSEPARTTAEETRAKVSSSRPDTKHIDAGSSDDGQLRQGTTATPTDDTGLRADTAETPRETSHLVTSRSGPEGPAGISAPLESSQGSSQAAPRVGMDGTAGADHASQRGIAERGLFPAAPDDATVSAKPVGDQSPGDTKAVPGAERPLQTGVGSLSAPPNEARWRPERAAAAQGPSMPLSSIAQTLAGAVEIASRDVPLVPGGFARSGSVFDRAVPSTSESGKPSGEGAGLGRPNGSAVTQAFSLPGVIYSGSTPIAGGSGLSFFGPLPRSERAQTSDGGLTVADARFSGQHASATSLAAPTATYRPELPQHIMVQIAAALENGKAGSKKTIDLSLSPEELGRVRLRLSPSEGGLNVVIVAERSETLELLRRNIDMLAREFLDIGYEGASFDFAGGQQEQADGLASIPLPPASEVPGTAPAIQAGETRVLALGERLDIRL